MDTTKQPLGPLQQKWIEELRSGRWTQIHFELRDSCNGRCCLGVACDVAGVRWSHGYAFDLEGRFSDVTLPFGVKDYMGFRNEGGESKEKADLCLWELNDIAKKTFSEIADIVEADPSKYFSRPA